MRAVPGMGRRGPSTTALGLGLLGVLGLAAGLPGPAAAREVGAVPPHGCLASAYDLRDTAVDGIVPSSAMPAPVLTVTLVHPCGGPLYVDAIVTVGLLPTAADSAFAVIQGVVTCVAGGCPVTGLPITSSGAGVASREKNTSQSLASVPLATVFPDLPRGIYTVEVLAFGRTSTLLFRHLRVWSAGQPAGAGRPRPP